MGFEPSLWNDLRAILMDFSSTHDMKSMKSMKTQITSQNFNQIHILEWIGKEKDPFIISFDRSSLHYDAP